MEAIGISAMALIQELKKGLKEAGVINENSENK